MAQDVAVAAQCGALTRTAGKWFVDVIGICMPRFLALRIERSEFWTKNVLLFASRGQQCRMAELRPELANDAAVALLRRLIAQHDGVGVFDRVGDGN